MKGKGRVIFLVIGFIVFFAMGAQATDWIFFATNPQGNNCYYDPQSIKRDFVDIVQVREKFVYSKKNQQNMIKMVGPKFKGLSYSTVLLRFNCSGKKMQLLSFTNFNKDGTVINSSSYDSPSWYSIVPGPDEEILINIVCGSR